MPLIPNCGKCGRLLTYVKYVETGARVENWSVMVSADPVEYRDVRLRVTDSEFVETATCGFCGATLDEATDDFITDHLTDKEIGD